jgi:opacity protein-like surface antigen
MNKYLTGTVIFLCLIVFRVNAQDNSPIANRMPVDTAGSELELGAVAGGENNTFLKKWSFGLNGGYSHRLPNAGTRMDTPYSKHMKKMKAGLSLGAELHHYFWERIGLGIKYNFYNTRGTYGKRTADDIKIQFVGPSVIYRYPLENKTTSILTGFAMGYQSYANDGKVNDNDFKLRGHATGWAVSLGLEQRLSNHLSLNLTGACYLGKSYKLRKESGGVTETIKLTKETFEDLSRAEITLGLRFY